MNLAKGKKMNHMIWKSPLATAFAFSSHLRGDALSGEVEPGFSVTSRDRLCHPSKPHLSHLWSDGVGQASRGQCLCASMCPGFYPLCVCPLQVFPREVINYTAENIYKWALENREMLLRWLRPHGGKSLLLNNELKKGPALFLFIPFNPLAESHPLIDEVRLLRGVS